MSDYTLSARRPSECIFTSSRSGEQTHFPVKTKRATFRSWPTLNANAMQRYNNFPIKRNSLAENRVSLSIFNYHTWIEYENHTRKIRCYLHFCNESNRLDAISGFRNRIRLSSRERYPRMLTLPYQMVLLSIMAA